MGFFSAPPVSLLRRPPVAQGLRARVGADLSPYKIDEIGNGNLGVQVAIFSLKATGAPVWAYARQYTGKSGLFEIWLYLAQAGISIFCPTVTPARWTNVSKYVAQSATAADATLIETADVSKGGVVQSGNALYASDAFGVSEVQLAFEVMSYGSDGDIITPTISIKAAKGLAKIKFTPLDIYNSLVTKFGLALTPEASKDLPAPPPAPTTSTPAPAPSSDHTGLFLALGAVAVGAIMISNRRSLGLAVFNMRNPNWAGAPEDHPYNDQFHYVGTKDDNGRVYHNPKHAAFAEAERQRWLREKGR